MSTTVLTLLMTLLVTVLALNDGDPCMTHKTCSGCLSDPKCGWLHGIQNMTGGDHCTTYCVTANPEGTGPENLAFSQALALARSPSCPCRLRPQCGLWFTLTNGGCPDCFSHPSCDDCLSQKGCNMHTLPPFDCAEYTFHLHSETNGTEATSRQLWVGEECGILCSVEYSFTDCMKCVERKDLIATGKCLERGGVVCGWCGEPMWSKNSDQIAECFVNIQGKPYGNMDRCAHGNISKWFTYVEGCEPVPAPYVVPFPYLSVVFPCIIAVVFMILVAVYIFRNREPEAQDALQHLGVSSPLKSPISKDQFYQTHNIQNTSSSIVL